VERAKKSLEQFDLEGHIKDAIHQLELAKDKASPNTDLTETRALLGLAYWRSYRDTQSIEERTKAARESAAVTNMDSGLAYFVQGKVALDLDGPRLPEAIHLLSRANELYKEDNCEALVGLAVASSLSGDSNNAELYFEKARKVGRKSWSDYNNLGWYYSQSGNLEAAVTNFHQALDLTRQGSPLAWRNLGGVLLLQNNTNEAMHACNESLKLRKTPDAYSLQGSIFFYEKEWQAAADGFLLAQNGSRTDYQFRGNAGLLLLKVTNRQAEAKGYLGDAVDMAEIVMRDSSNCLVEARIGLYRAALGQTNEADRCLRNALEQCPDNSSVLSAAIEAYTKLRDKLNADPLIQRQLEQSPGERSELEDAIDSYRQLGDTEKATRLQKLLDELPNPNQR
jgi:tetratricopeptide (TPR) repeat protein